MNQKLIDLLGLDAAATDDQIVAAIGQLKSFANSAAKAAAGEKEIRDLIAASGGALNREAARQVLADRKTAAREKSRAKG